MTQPTNQPHTLTHTLITPTDQTYIHTTTTNKKIQMGQPTDSVATRWGGGCTSTLFGKVCGFS